MKYLYLHGLGKKTRQLNRVIKRNESIEKQSQFEFIRDVRRKAATYMNYIQHSHQNAIRRTKKLSYVGFHWELF